MNRLKAFGWGMSLLVMQTAWAGSINTVEKPFWVSVSDVLSRPSDFDGKEITIMGWASVRHEDWGIWASKADYVKRNSKQCISLLNYYADDSLNKALDRSTVLVTGTFLRDIRHDKDGQELVRLGTCSDVGIRFKEPDGLRKFED